MASETLAVRFDDVATQETSASSVGVRFTIGDGARAQAFSFLFRLVSQATVRKSAVLRTLNTSLTSEIGS